MQICVDDKFFNLNISIENLTYKETRVKKSVEDDILNFLMKCYTLIPYRNSHNEIRNISNIILNTSRNLEDNFLMFYRFVECYYKPKSISEHFIEYSYKHNYKLNSSYNVEDITAEIISLRNQYVHRGYHIKNERLKITYKKINGESNPKNYLAKNINFEWIYERTEILYKIVIDIIFSNMLGYETYNFNKSF